MKSIKYAIEMFWNIMNIIIRFILTKVLGQTEKTEELLNRIIQFIKFGLVGLLNTFISYFVYVILVMNGLHYILASIAGFIVSVLNAYYWNNKYVFTVGENETRSPIFTLIKTFVSYAGTGLVLSNVLLFIWIDILSANEIVAPLLNLVITIPLNYVINKFWSYKGKQIEIQENKGELKHGE